MFTCYLVGLVCNLQGEPRLLGQSGGGGWLVF
uniref:Uncharacterized protein n=1 Tax=Arundo donax TaxID=35708 RepID=A0A0A9FN03_ARUDO